MPMIQWLDYSSDERESILELLAVQQDKGTLDELGIGTVRDAIADHFFPPLSTIQTRAKYFLFVPWIYRGLEQGTVKNEGLRLRGEQRERALIKALLRSPSDDKAGLIGKEKPEDLKRLPSSIYWSGARRLNIFRDASSLAEYLHELDAIRVARQRRQEAMKDDGEDPASIDTGLSWDPGLPALETDFLTSSSFDLDFEQATYLKQKTLGLTTATNRTCLLQWLVLHADLELLEDMTVPWQLLEAQLSPALPEHLAAELRHARHFALCMQTLTALYYRFLAEGRRDLDSKVYDLAIAQCASAMADHTDALHAWQKDLPAFWTWVSLVNPRLQRDQPFIERWLNELAAIRFSPGDARTLTTNTMRRFVQQRERELKRELARIGNPAVLARWIPPSTVPLLEYRWSTARHFIRDVRRGLART